MPYGDVEMLESGAEMTEAGGEMTIGGAEMSKGGALFFNIAEASHISSRRSSAEEFPPRNDSSSSYS